MHGFTKVKSSKTVCSIFFLHQPHTTFLLCVEKEREMFNFVILIVTNWSCQFHVRPRKQASPTCDAFISNSSKFFTKLSIGKSASILLTLRIPPHSNVCYWSAGSCDSLDIGWPTKLLKFLFRRFFSQSASTLQSGYSGLTLKI